MDLQLKPNKIRPVAANYLWICGAIALVSSYSCLPTEYVDIDFTTPCRDKAEAINRIYESLPRQMTIEQRCKRYAVFLAMTELKGVSDRLALLQLKELVEDTLDVLYERVRTADLAARYMTTIDLYRRSHLEPAFVDLIDCLRQINLPLVKNYLDDSELTVVENLYRRALGPPAIAIDLDSVELDAFPPAFRITLRNLFAKHSEMIGQDHERNSNPINLFNQLSPSYESLKSAAYRFIRRTEARISQRETKRLRQMKHRQLNLERVRENDRIRKKRQQDKLRLERALMEGLTAEQRDSSDGPSYKRLARYETAQTVGREKQKRYRERNLEHVRARGRERERRRRQRIKEKKSIQKSQAEPENPPP